MVGWHHQLNGHQFVQTLGDGERQGSLMCCSPRGRKESDMTQILNNKADFMDKEMVLNHGCVSKTSGELFKLQVLECL